jgi:hypothetical protein
MNARISGYTAALVRSELPENHEDGEPQHHGIAPDEPATLCGIERDRVLLIRSYMIFDDPRSCAECQAEARRRVSR